MIVVQDRIIVPGHQLARLQALFRERYMEDAALRGLHFTEFLVSPPLALTEAPCTLWVRWQVADAGAWWAMRAQSSSAAVAAFWAEVDDHCLSRERCYLGADSPAALPQPVDVGVFAVSTRTYRESAQLVLHDAVTASQRTELEDILRGEAGSLPSLTQNSLGANLAPEYAAGHYTWDLLYPDRNTAEAAQRSATWRERILPALEKYFHYRNLDVSSIKELVRRWRPELLPGLKKDATHLALDDIRDSIRELRYYREYFIRTS